jgi:hypothetical protein
MSQPLTNRTKQLIERIADQSVKAEILALFESEGALYGPPTVEVLERVRFSVVKLAMQGHEKFKGAERLYRTDTRDLLVAAGFANDLKAHENWCETILNPNA